MIQLPTNTITEIFPLIKLSRNSVSLLMKSETFTHIHIPTSNNHYVAIWIPGTAEPGGLLSMGSHRVGHNWSDLAAAAAAGAHFTLGKIKGLFLTGPSHHSMRLFGAKKCPELQSIFCITWGWFAPVCAGWNFLSILSRLIALQGLSHFGLTVSQSGLKAGGIFFSAKPKGQGPCHWPLV